MKTIHVYSKKKYQWFLALSQYSVTHLALTVLVPVLTLLQNTKQDKINKK